MSGPRRMRKKPTQKMRGPDQIMCLARLCILVLLTSLANHWRYRNWAMYIAIMTTKLMSWPPNMTYSIVVKGASGS